MMESKIVFARKLLKGGAATKDVVHYLGTPVYIPYRWLPASAKL